MTRKARYLLIGAAIGLAAAAGIAYAATLSVTTAAVTTSKGAVTIAPKTCTLSAVADATVDRGTQNSNFGGTQTLEVRSQNGNRQKRTLVRFDIASCSIPVDAVIRTSELNLTMTSPPSANRTYGIHRVSAAWNESTVTYANHPGFLAAPTGTVNTGTTATTLVSSVATDVTAFVSGAATNQGWLVKDLVETANPGIETAFGSDENAAAGVRPSLVITYFD